MMSTFTPKEGSGSSRPLLDRNRRNRRLWHLGLALCLPLLFGRFSAAAEEVDKTVARLNKRAMADYDALEFDGAKKALVDAVSLLRTSGLDETPLAAKTYANLGVVYISGFKDRARGQQQFVNALKIKPDLRLDPALATPETDEAFAAAKRQVAAAKAAAKVAVPTPPRAEPSRPPVAEVKGLVHTPVDDAPPRTAITIRALLGAELGATKLVLFFRGGGQEDFISEPMRNTQGSEWVGLIPAETVIGRAMQYYLEARDARGRVVVTSGSAASPYIIAVTERALATPNLPEIEVEDPEMRERQRQKREAEERNNPRHRDHVFLFVMPGFGFGYEPGGNHTEVAWQFQVSGAAQNSYIQQPVGQGGVAIAPFHLGVELGVLVTQHISLSLVGRFQLVTGANAQTVNPDGLAQNPTTKAFGALAGMARARYLFLNGRFHPYLHVDLGGGEIRHALDVHGAQSDAHPLVDRNTALAWNASDKTMQLPIQEVCANHNSCVDTIGLGYLFVGGGAGLWYDFAKHFAFLLDLNLLGSVGVGSQPGLNVDVQIGIGAHFL